MSELQYIGKPAQRVDTLDKVLGTAKYAGDYKLPDMVYARCLRSDVPHARVVRVDVTPALRVPGVLAAITSADFVNQGRFGFPVADMYMLVPVGGRVRYVGDAIAAVAAETEEALAAGLAAITVELAPLPGVFDPEEALQPDAPLVGEQPWDAPGEPRGNLLVKHIVRKGDPDASAARLRDHPGQKVQHRAPGARLHRDRGRARGAVAAEATLRPVTTVVCIASLGPSPLRRRDSKGNLLPMSTPSDGVSSLVRTALRSPSSRRRTRASRSSSHRRKLCSAVLGVA